MTIPFALLAGLSFGLTLWQWHAARRFPLNRRQADSSVAPPVTLLKPLKGCDEETERCLRSWFDQDYLGPVQILLGVASEADPVCALVRQLLEAYPKADARLVICSKSLGPNAKISTLVQLQALALHEYVVISDADVLAPLDLLRNVTAPLRDREMGLVNCFYQLANPSTLAMQWEAVAINADFWTQVLQSQDLKPLDFALGAVMATSQTWLHRMGGFSELLEYLADDYQLGHKIAAQGGRIALCPVVVDCRSDAHGWQTVWTHQLRWSRTIRVCQPVPFFFSILSNATLWPLLWVAIDRTALSAIAALFALVRLWAARDHQVRLRGSPIPWPLFGMAWLKDLLAVPIWIAAFGGNRIHWRGCTYQLLPDGKLKPVAD